MDYEFTQIENDTIKKTGDRAFLYGYASIVMGAVGILGGLGSAAIARGRAIPVGAGIAIALLPNVVAGFWYIQAGQALRNVVATQGNDISLMMTALSRVRDVFKLEGIASILGFVLGLILGAGLYASMAR